MNQPKENSDFIYVNPNPSNGDITISATMGSYTILNNQGIFVENFELKNQEDSFEINNLTNGIYFVVSNSLSHASKKLVVIR